MSACIAVLYLNGQCVLMLGSANPQIHCLYLLITFKHIHMYAEGIKKDVSFGYLYIYIFYDKVSQCIDDVFMY